MILRSPKTHQLTPLTLGVLSAGIAIFFGLVLAYGGWIAGAGLIIALIAGLIIIRDIELGFWANIFIVALLPFATIPIDLGLTPTFIDCTLGAVVGVWFLQLITRQRRTIITAPITVPIILFLIIAIFAFIFGLQNGPFTPTLARKFAELLLSIGFVIVVIDYARDWDIFERAIRICLYAGGAAALVAIGLWIMPDDLANQLLNYLSRIGYPGGWVIRYIEENPALNERAIGTSIDPNALGGLLTLFAALAVPQAITSKPIVPRWQALLINGLLVVAILLTFSRGAFLAFGASVAFVAVLRYHKLIPLGIAGVIALFILPFTQGYVVRLIQGLSFLNFYETDLASQMRLGEFTDAWALISRYPVFGVGFAGSPDIDLYLGVANVYLSIAQQMGFVGLGAFFVIIIGLFVYGGLNWRSVWGKPKEEAVLLGLYSAVIGGLAAGLFDHYLFNTEFHHTVTAFWMMVGLAAAATRLTSTPLTKLPPEA